MGRMRTSLSLLAAALVVGLVLIPRPVANGQSPAAGGEPGQDVGPVGCSCVVTLDPQRDRETPTGGTRRDGTLRSGIESGGIVTGTLVRCDAQWVVLRDGTYENWIPRDKVLSMRVSR